MQAIGVFFELTHLPNSPFTQAPLPESAPSKTHPNILKGAPMGKQESMIEVAGRQIKVSNLEKVLYPKVGFTKGQVLDYFVRVAPVLLPHLAGRPLTLNRYPEGVEGMFFYEKNCPKHKPEWVKTAKVW